MEIFDLLTIIFNLLSRQDVTTETETTVTNNRNLENRIELNYNYEPSIILLF